MQGKMSFATDAARQLADRYAEAEAPRSKAAFMLDKHTTGKILGAAIKVHAKLGPGLREEAYKTCLMRELERAGLRTERSKMLPVEYHREEIEEAYEIDLLVEDKVVVLVKSVDELREIHTAQLDNYLRLSGCRYGLLINFNVRRLRNGIRQMNR